MYVKKIKSGIVVQRLSLLRNFIHQSLNSGSVQVQIMLAACQRFAMVRTSQLETILNAFHRSIIPQKQFIIIIIIIIIITFGILLHSVVKMENIQQELWMIQRLRVMKLQSHLKKKQKLFQEILRRTKQPVKRKTSIFYLFFINCYSIIHSSQCLLLFDKISSETKTSITIAHHK